MNKKIFLSGIKAMLPIIPGVVPFGLVMGTVASSAGLSLYQTMAMNTFVFAGASQLAAVDLMLQNVSSFIVILTGIIINLRFMLYSAALSKLLESSSVSKKIISSYFITDQSYSVFIINEDKMKKKIEKITFYLGAGLMMTLAWQASVLSGFIFGNLAPSSLSLEYAVPLSFVALVLPTIKNRSYLYVALLSSLIAVVFKSLPFNLGLLLAGAAGISLGAFLSRKEVLQND